jgi:predicted ATPase
MIDLAGTAEIATAWCVITGPPSAGKTTVLDALAARGHRVVPETARAHIAELGHAPADIAASPTLQARIQHGIAARQRAVELALAPADALFLDRALPDSIAYFEQLKLATEALIASAARLRYRRVFYLQGLPLAADGLRFEDDHGARAIGDAILRAYRRLGYAPVIVPAPPRADLAEAVAERLGLILRHLG